MKSYFLLKVSAPENVFFEVYETEREATTNAERYYHFAGEKNKILVTITEVKEFRPVFHKSKNC